MEMFIGLRRSRGTRTRTVLAVLLLLAAAQLWILKALHYSSCLVFTTQVDELKRAPSPNFHIAEITWDTTQYATAVELAPFREEFLANCAGKLGLDAARCVAEKMTDRFPWGMPANDFYSRNFDAVSDFRAHMAGEAGHCVTRSEILVNQLLSVGIPARVTQIFWNDGRGHNIAEVWDNEFGWTLFDPSFGGTLGIGGKPISAERALATRGDLTLLGDIRAASLDNKFYKNASAMGGTILYPSPWRYTRTGPRSTSWPFLGKFALVGSGWFRYGGAQWVLRVGILYCLSLALIFLILGRRRRAQFETQILPLPKTVSPMLPDLSAPSAKVANG